MGFKRRDLGDGYYDMVRPLPKGYALEYVEGVLELAHGGYAVPLRCRSRKHLEMLIKVL